MIRYPRATLAVAFAALLAACGGSEVPPAPDETQTGQASARPETVASASPPTSSPTTPATDADENDGVPDITPAPLTPEAGRTEKGARTNLLAWARGIELREFDQAWNLMGDAAKAQTSRAQFNALFHPLRDITVAVPGGEMEGAAGSSYYTVPTTVTGTRTDGTKVVLKGDVVLRRVNDVDGATPAQLKWHIEQVNLRPA